MTDLKQNTMGAATCLTCVAGMSVHADIITNGSFEADTVSPTDSFTYADDWSNARTASTAPLLANEGTNRTFTGDDSTVISQLTGTSASAGDLLTLDFFGNSAAAGRGWVGSVTLDGGSGTKVVLGSITLNMDASVATWDQANAAATTFSVSAVQIATAGAGATYGVEFVGTTGSGFKGLDSVSLDVVPEPGSLALLGLGGLLVAARRRRA